MARSPLSFPSWGALALSTASSRTLSVLLLISCAFLLATISATSNDGHEAAEATSKSPLPLIHHLSPLHVSHRCSESERIALLRFKAGLDDPYGRLSSWRGPDCCRWAGVTCHNLSGSVIKVDLQNASQIFPLSGRIDSSLLQLKSLRHLDLSGNSFHHIPIPDFIGSFKELRYLNLSHSGFAGTVPPRLGNLSCLQYLDLSCDLPGLLRADSLQWLSGLSSLRYLALDGVNLSTVGPDWVHPLNERLSFLAELHLRDCNLGSIPASLHYVNFTSLEVLDLSSNLFSSRIPSWLPNISSLAYVDVSNCRLHGPLPVVGFSELPYLRHLNLGYNQNLTANISELLGHGGWQRINTLSIPGSSLYGEIPASIGNITSLARLDLSSNNIRGALPGSIAKLCQLSELDLSYNDLTGELPAAVGQLSELTNLDVSSNQLSGIVTEAHFSSLSKLKTLRLGNNSLILNVSSSDWIPPFQLNFLDMASCQLGPAFPLWIFKSQRELEEISLPQNGISDELPTWFGDFPSKHNLRFLSLSENNLTGGIPTSIGELKNLEALALSANKLTGGIPMSIGELKNLEALGLSANNLTGGIPTSIGELKNLERLILWRNNLTDGIPTSIGKLKNLVGLDLSANKLTGGIPTSIGELKNLTYLGLWKNNLTGGIPTSIGKLKNLTYLGLSGNQLTGGIPTSIGELKNLERLFLLRNNLTGGIPTSIGKLKKLAGLDLSENKLTGGIPTTSLLDCSSLEFLNLGGNNFSGDIPTSHSDTLMNGLRLLNLSRNMLTGEFPSFIRNLSLLETLDLTSNKLHGNIPTWIASVQALRILKLRSNRFSGEIPSQLSNLKFLQVLDVANNSLTGPIPEQLGSLKGMLHVAQPDSYFGNRTSYWQTLVVHMKGSDREIVINTILFLTSIDLSENKLSGKFPESLINLSGLVVLDLSRNFLTGTIPEMIGDMHSLESLDLSGNHFTGRIPPSMASLSFLGFLNLSNNNFSGEIPVGGHLDTFDEASFLGNPYLCGPFLQRHCPRDNPQQVDVNKDEEKLGEDDWFYLGMGLGFAFGLLGPFLILIVRRGWSEAYFGVVDQIIDRLF